MEDSLLIDNSYERVVKIDLNEKVDSILSDYFILNHFRTSALTGQNVKQAFDEAILYMLRFRSAQLQQQSAAQESKPIEKSKPKN